MDEKESILKFMVIDHGKMYEFLSDFRFRLGQEDKEGAVGAFNLFKQKESRHIDAEENVVFKFNKKIEKIKILEVIKKQHIEAGKMIKKIEEKLNSQEDPTEETEKLQEFLRKHTNLEEKSFYPILEKELTKEQKIEMINKIDEISNVKKTGVFKKFLNLFK